MPKPPLDLIRHALEEEGVETDVTTLCRVPRDHQGKAKIIARQAGVTAGLIVASATFREQDPQVSVELLVDDGTTVQAAQVVAHLSGPARSLLSAERVALNFLGHLSGIATITAQCVRAIEGTKVRILDTRKTTPGLRSLEKEAVRLGGGHNHRFTLTDGELIKNTHIKATGGIVPAITLARRMDPHLLKNEVQCDSLAEEHQALEAVADVLLLEKMPV